MTSTQVCDGSAWWIRKIIAHGLVTILMWFADSFLIKCVELCKVSSPHCFPAPLLCSPQIFHLWRFCPLKETILETCRIPRVCNICRHNLIDNRFILSNTRAFYFSLSNPNWNNMLELATFCLEFDAFEHSSRNISKFLACRSLFFTVRTKTSHWSACN